MQSRNLSLVLVMSFITFFSNILYSQVENTIVDTNSVWSIYKELVVSEPIPTSYYIHLKGDTVIDSKHYKKIWTNNELYPINNMEFYGLIREENQKTYVRYMEYSLNRFSDEYSLYDFSLSVGDSILLKKRQNLWYIVRSVDSIEINNEIHKRIILYNYVFPNITWVEKIGCLEIGLLYIPRLFNAGCVEKLLCYYNKNNCLYTNPAFNYCSLSLENIVEENGAIIYPNPVKDYLNIESKQIMYKIEILDTEGKLLISNDTINGKTHSINISSQSSGVYIIKIIYNNGQIKLLKFLKQ